MTQFDPAELSALLDNELPAARAAELRAAIAADPALRAEFAALENNDRYWRETSGAARFTPSIALPEPRAALDSTAFVAALLVALAAAHLLSKAPDALAWELGAQAALLCAALAWAIHLALTSDDKLA